jgi:hypothetical protein
MEVGQLESMHTSIKVQLEARVSDLESKLSRAKEGWRQAEHRRALDSEGFTNDVSLLRKQLAAVDRKLHGMRLKSRLEDDERLEGLLKKVAGKGPPLRDQVLSASLLHFSSALARSWPYDLAILSGAGHLVSFLCGAGRAVMPCCDVL